MQYNYDFHLHHHLVDGSQMLGGFESLHYNKNVHSVSWYGKPNFLPAPNLICCIDYQIPGREFLIFVKNVNGENGKFRFCDPSLRKPRALRQAKSML